MAMILELIALAKKTASSILNSEKPFDLQDSACFDQNDKKYIVDNVSNELDNPDRIEFVKGIDAHKEFQLIESKLIVSKQQFFLRGIFFRWYAAAALVLILISVSVVYFRTEKPVYEINQVVEIAEPLKKPLYKNDIKPANNKATLTLSNGTIIVLDDESKGALAKQGNASIVKMDGKRLVYNPQDTINFTLKTPIYNTLSTPRGGQYNITLSDGTNVWLNSATTLIFPIAFVGNERRVEVIGEAYFEVAKNQKQPFIVKAENQEIKVLGTHFNVSAYADDKMKKTTLIEGSVQILIMESLVSEVAKTPVTLVPGQQFQFIDNNQLSIVDTDIEEAIAWKNGLFIFKNENIESIMMKIARWYDISVVYDVDPINNYFTGKISNSKNISEVLTMLELTDAIHFKIEGKTITVLP